MSEPKRYLDGDRDTVGARLLAAAEHDAPGRRAFQRAAAAVAAATAATAVSGAGSAAGTVAGAGAAAWLKWLAVGALAGGVAAGGATVLYDGSGQRSDDPATGQHGAPVVPPLGAPRAARPADEPRRANEQPAIATPEPVPAEGEPAPGEAAPTPATPRVRAAEDAPSASADEPPRPPADTLGAELRQIDAARSKQASGDARGAIAELDRYRRQYPRGRFLEEAELLRAESLAALGDCGAAKAIARASGRDATRSLLSRRWDALRQKCR